MFLSSPSMILLTWIYRDKNLKYLYTILIHIISTCKTVRLSLRNVPFEALKLTVSQRKKTGFVICWISTWWKNAKKLMTHGIIFTLRKVLRWPTNSPIINLSLGKQFFRGNWLNFLKRTAINNINKGCAACLAEALLIPILLLRVTKSSLSF